MSLQRQSVQTLLSRERGMTDLFPLAQNIYPSSWQRIRCQEDEERGVKSGLTCFLERPIKPKPRTLSPDSGKVTLA